MRISSKALDEKLYTPVNRSFTAPNNRGIIYYGQNNDYPECFEKLILSSQTAKACYNILTNFIAGSSFKEDIGSIVVGTDREQNKMTLDILRYKIAESLAMYNGVYIHTNKNQFNEVVNVQIVPFKKCRLQTPDDYGYSGKVAVCNNWSSYWTRNKKLKWYNNFTLNDEATHLQIENAGGIENWTGQVYHFFKDDFYFYPLSVFDVVEFEMNTENLVQIYKNREVANGFNKKTVIYIPRTKSDEEFAQIENSVKDFMGPDGAKELILECDFDSDANLINAYKFEQLESNIDPNIFDEQYQKSLTNNIRKAANGMPAVLIDYDNAGLGQVSGESISQAYTFYNAMTEDYRTVLTNILKTVFAKTTISALKDKTFEINEKMFSI